MYTSVLYSKLSSIEGPSTDKTSHDDDYDRASLFSSKGHQRSRTRYVQFKRYVPWLLHLCSITICLCILSYALVISKPSRRDCIDRFNAYSPVLEGIDTDYHEERFKYSLWYQSPFKGPPTPEVEAAWHEIMKYGQISVPATDILAIGHNLSTSARYPPHIANGSYLATAMGTHSLHCLHYIWRDHYISTTPATQQLKADIPEMYERHYEHCVDYIRQELMCKFDTTIMPFSWVLDHQNPTPNGNTIHKCVDWGYLQGWLKDRAVEMPEGFVWSQPKDAMVLDWNP